MPLTFNEDIKMADILTIEEIVVSKVWRVKGRNNDDLIIKTEGPSEQHNPRDIKYVNKIVRAVVERDKGLIGKEMKRSELDAINSFCMKADEKQKKELESLLQSINQPFFKMVVARELVTLDDIEKHVRRNNANPIEAKRAALPIMKSLESDGGYESLGRILSADLFNHNKDRFDNSNWDIEGSVIRNPGNVMFALAGIGNERLLPVGMDNYDVQSEFRRLSVSHPSMQGALDKWTGFYLRDSDADRNDLNTFIERIVQSLFGLLNKADTTSNISEADAIRRIHEGVAQGVCLIKYKLYRAKNIPTNISERMGILGWLHINNKPLAKEFIKENNLVARYNQKGRWSITKNEKRDTVKKLWTLMGDAPEAFDKIIYSLVCFKMSRKSGAAQDAESALRIVEASLKSNGFDLSSEKYPTTSELMTLVKNRSFIAQRAIPETFKKFLIAIPPSIRDDIFSDNPKTNGIAIAERMNDIRIFLNNNGIQVQH